MKTIEQFWSEISTNEELAEKLEQIIVYRWNRHYPADFYFGIALETPAWTRIRTEEFAGSSHEKITKDVYTP